MGKELRTNKVIQISQSELRCVLDVFKKWTSEATTLAMTCFLMTLHEKEEWGAVRLSRLWGEVEKLMGEVYEGRVDVYDLKKTLEEELGIYISRGEGNGQRRLE